MTDTSQYYPKDLDIRFVLTTKEQETDLFTKARAGDEEAREFLIRNYLLFAANCARRMTRGKLPDNDVVSAANHALMRAFEKFDHTRGNRFAGYLKPFIKGAVTELWRGLSIVYIPPGKKDLNPPESPAPLEKPVVDPHAEAEQEDHRAFLKEMLGECSGALTDREREILKLVYDDGLNFSKAARKIGLSRQFVSLRHRDALTKLKAAFKRKGIKASE